MKPVPDPTPSVDLNRSGLATSPALADSMLEVPALTRASLQGEEALIADERVTYSLEGEPAVTMPPPSRLEKTAVLIDKLGERLAFERSSVRLYEALLSKFDAFGSFERGPAREELEAIRADEQRHFKLLAETVRELGSDLTAVTPSANVQDVLGAGLRQVMTDPRANLAQGLEAVLVEELADNDSWALLVRLARKLGREQLVERFTACLAAEEEHLRLVRGWLSAALDSQAGVED